MTALTITIFTNPMMGLSYESEPFLRKVQSHFPSVIIKNVMSGLVRNVYDFVDKNDLAISKEYAINRYLPHLAEIYNAERAISGMPIFMHNLRLFSTERPSSIPLNQQDLQNDFAYRAKMGVRGLPAYLFDYQGKQFLANGVLNDDDFFRIINQLSNGELQPTTPVLNLDNVWALIQKQRLISPIEIQYAFDLANCEPLEPILQALEKQQKIIRKLVVGGEFITSVFPQKNPSLSHIAWRFFVWINHCDMD